MFYLVDRSDKSASLLMCILMWQVFFYTRIKYNFSVKWQMCVGVSFIGRHGEANVIHHWWNMYILRWLKIWVIFHQVNFIGVTIQFSIHKYNGEEANKNICRRMCEVWWCLRWKSLFVPPLEVISSGIWQDKYTYVKYEMYDETQMCCHHSSWISEEDLSFVITTVSVKIVE